MNPKKRNIYKMKEYQDELKTEIKSYILNITYK